LIVTDNQKKFLREQLALLAGFPLEVDIPHEYSCLLLGKAEADMVGSDNRGNKDFQHNPLFWSGKILEPAINQWIRNEIKRNGRKNLNPKQIPLWPEGKEFAVCLTHDVDHVRTHSFKSQWRYLKFRLQENSIRSKIQFGLLEFGRLILATAKSQREEIKKGFFEPLLELEKRYGFRSTFFFFPDEASEYHLRDGPNYRHQDMVELQGRHISVMELMRELESNAWEVGLHGTFNSYNNSLELLRQKQQIEHAIGSQIVSIRQHCLHYNVDKTPRAQSQAGFKYDSTFGFNRIMGFRAGLALPFYHYDLQADKPLPILQIPLIIQDGALLRSDNLDLTPKLALRYAKKIIDKVQMVNGLVTLLWHPNVCNDTLFPGWFWVYQELLRHIADKKVWVAPVREIGAWWEQRQKLLSYE
jgi:peptidoglycan/xylan/chitin deacetylase (PgdA/CDA1 family)